MRRVFHAGQFWGWLVCCLAMIPCATSAADPATLAELVFDAATFLTALEVEKVDADGNVTARQADIGLNEREDRSASMTEGYYIAFVLSDEQLASRNPFQPDTPLLRVQVQEVLPERGARLHVGPQAIGSLKPRTKLLMIRTRDLTTAQLKALPDVVLLSNPAAAAAGPGRGTGPQLAVSMNNMKQIALGLHNFASAHGSFPPPFITGPDGKPWHSWRVLLLPYLEGQSVYEAYRFDEPWDGPNNSKLLDKMPAVYGDDVFGENKEHYTHYALVTGPGMMFATEGPQMQGNKLPALRGTKFAEITDGLSNTVMVVPVPPDAKIPWMKPADLVVGEKLPEGEAIAGVAWAYGPADDSFAPFGLADGSVQVFKRSNNPQQFRALLTRDGREPVGGDDFERGDAGQGGGAAPKIVITRDGDTVQAVVHQ